MNLRLAFALMIGLGLAMVVFLLMTLALSAVRGAEFLTPTALSVLGLGCMLVAARPAWAIAKRLAPASPSDRE
ncbi:hypothetical protein [Alteriqipengyuania lutimaris]|uniref:Uncharacterized protein n=1 Tax=Alteriqipengyuania lutimaris TaxID=1538146 RepID=A0A395LUR0_9SPHN|nr:hypothetical protein [Alteriqipengyuania lutimaris]MBB3032733.1 hypothetical protein [Alteriqipengyuania lutimaris]RDS78160.1 hypothetical protein DL238_11475 [Alteriqipengyuania lutimaris]